MSGTASVSMVGVKRPIAPTAPSQGDDSGNAIESRNARASSPSVTTMRGWVMCSSRVSHARDWSRSSASGSMAALRQAVP